jgi:hypothetical protein
MSTFLRCALIAGAMLSSVSAASAHTSLNDDNKTASQLNFSNPDDVKAFWELQSRRSK